MQSGCWLHSSPVSGRGPILAAPFYTGNNNFCPADLTGFKNRGGNFGSVQTLGASARRALQSIQYTKRIPVSPPVALSAANQPSPAQSPTEAEESDARRQEPGQEPGAPLATSARGRHGLTASPGGGILNALRVLHSGSQLPRFSERREVPGFRGRPGRVEERCAESELKI